VILIGASVGKQFVEWTGSGAGEINNGSGIKVRNLFEILRRILGALWRWSLPRGTSFCANNLRRWRWR
jgi:hypothetical protein